MSDPTPIAAAHVLVPTTLLFHSRILEGESELEREKTVGEMTLLAFPYGNKLLERGGEVRRKARVFDGWDREKFQALAEFDVGSVRQAASGDGQSWWGAGRGVLPGRLWRGWGARLLPSDGCIVFVFRRKIFPVSIFLMR